MGGIKLLKASAGSGKTYQLAYEYIRSVIADPVQYGHILAVTFTNKATEEMKNRILSEIYSLSKGSSASYMRQLERDTGLSCAQISERANTALKKILHDYSRFAVLTIDKFFQRIIRAFIRELGVDINFNLELRTDSILSSAADAVIDEISVNEELKRWILDYIEEKIDDNRKWDIKTGLISLGKEIFRESYKNGSSAIMAKEELGRIVARASSEYFSIRNSISGEGAAALEIMSACGLECHDFSGGTRSFANYFKKAASGDICAYGSSVIKALESDDKWYSKTSPSKETIRTILPQLRTHLEKICRMYDENAVFINSVELLRHNYRNFALLSDLSEKIEKICAEDNIMLISQTNKILNKLISGNDTPFIFEKAGNYYSRFMIDEFQDTSAMQWENFLPLLHNSVSENEDRSVLLVGDIKQSIYRWRGGDWKILAKDVEKNFKDVLTAELTTNYRSFAKVVQFNNNIISRCVDLDNRYINSLLEEVLSLNIMGTETYGELHNILANAYRGHEQVPAISNNGGYVNLTVYGPDERDEYVPPVIKHIEELQQRGYSPGEIAILVRFNSQGVKIADMLLEHKRNNPSSPYSYDVVTQEALLIGSSDAVTFVKACMRLSCSRDDTLNRAIYNRWLGHDMDKEIDQKELDFLRQTGYKSPVEAMEEIIYMYDMNSNEQDVTYLQAFYNQAIKFSRSSISDIPLFLKWWEESGSSESINIPGGNSVTIISVHKAKGLQYKAVLIPYCDWPLTPKVNSIVWAKDGTGMQFENLDHVPIGYSDKMSSSVFAENYYQELVMSHIDNINTFYVATTRAMEELHIMIPQSSTSRKKNDRISSLITDSLEITSGTAVLGDMEGVVKTLEGNTVMEFGKPLYKKSPDVISDKKQQENIIDLGLISYPIGERLKLRLKSERYFEEGANDIISSPRNYGILMHSVFEKSDNMEDIQKNIDQMASQAVISSDEKEQILASIITAFENSTVREWFETEWDSVKKESDIIVSDSESIKRPDRVMLKGDRAVVVDYKFGLERRPYYARQIRNYVDLLQRMGYDKVEGFVWYVNLNDVEIIENVQS